MERRSTRSLRSLRSVKPVKTMKTQLTAEEQLDVDLANIDNIYKAEEHIRQLTSLSLTQKRALLRGGNGRLSELAANAANTPQQTIKKPVDKLARALRKFNEAVLMRFMQKQINAVERNLGIDAASYFKFAKWLVLHNLLAFFVIVLPFIGLPHIFILDNAASQLKSTTSTSTASPLLTTQLSENGENETTVEWLNRLAVGVPAANRSCLVKEDTKHVEVFDIIVAANAFRFTFFECFQSGTIVLSSHTRFFYNMQYAYVLTILAFYVYWLWRIISRLAMSITKTFIKCQMLLNKTVFSAKVFTSWPYSFTKAGFTAKKCGQIELDLFQNLKLADRGDTKNKTSSREWIVLIVVNGAYFTLVAGIAAGMYFFIGRLVSELNTYSAEMKRFLLALFINLVNYLTPFICNGLAYFENLQHSKAVIVKMFRMALIQMLTCGFTMWQFIIVHATCWETQVGQLIYAIIIIDFLLFLIDLLLLFIYKKVMSLFFKQHEMHFNIGYYTLNLIFSQALVWMGVYFNPFLTLLQIIKLLILFFTNAFVVKRLYKLPSKQWSTSRNNTYFLVITLATYLAIIGCMGYIYIEYETSHDCGPLTDYNTPYKFVIELKDYLSTVKGLGVIIQLFTSSGLIAFIFFLICVLMYSSFTLMAGHRRSVKLLKILHAETKKKLDFVSNEHNTMKAVLKRKNIDVDEMYAEINRALENVSGYTSRASRRTIEMSRGESIRKTGRHEDIEMITMMRDDYSMSHVDTHSDEEHDVMSHCTFATRDFNGDEILSSDEEQQAFRAKRIERIEDETNSSGDVPSLASRSVSMRSKTSHHGGSIHSASDHSICSRHNNEKQETQSQTSRRITTRDNIENEKRSLHSYRCHKSIKSIRSYKSNQQAHSIHEQQDEDDVEL